MLRKNILIVDRDKEFLRQLREDFQPYSSKYQVAFAACTAKAEEILERFKVDVVLANILLAGESGIALLPTIRRKHATIHVVLYGDSLTAEAKRAALYGGATAILHQPFSLKELLQVLTSLFPQDPQRASLNVLQLVDLLQLFSLGKHCTDIRVINSDLQQGIIRIRRGKLLQAEAAGKKDVAGLAEMLSWPYPTFETGKCDDETPPPDCKPLEQALLQAFIILDEH